MKVKRTSWHYKASTLFCDFEEGHTNLCWYFWRLVFTVVFILAILSLACLALYVYFTSLQFVSNTILAVAIILAIILPPLAIYFLREILGKAPELPKNILFDYVKAKKRKVCPLIEYTG